MAGLPQPVLVGLFLLAATVVWWAGIHLSRATDALDDRFGWGQAMGGMVLLALVTNLPEIAITASAAYHGKIDLAVGNILGGIAIQTLVLPVLDVFGNTGKKPLATLAASPQLLLEGLLVVAVLAIVLLGHQLPADLIFLRMTPAGMLIVGAWLGTLWLLHDRHGGRASAGKSAKGKCNKHNGHPMMMFVVTALATLVAGVVLELSGDALAGHWHMQGAVFGATVLAAATSLPEIATGLPAVRRKEYTLAVSDILGGNAFLPVLLVMATLISGHAALPAVKSSGLYLAALCILLTLVYVGAMILKPRAKWLGLGPDGWLVVALYVLGIGGLLVQPNA